jgi:PAS domain S-box-containing protein
VQGDTIAVIDADLARRVALVEALDARGLRSFGAAAVDRLGPDQPHPTLLVMQPRDEDALDTDLAELYADARLVGTPVIVVGEVVGALDAFARGAVDHVREDASVGELEARIRLRLKRHSTTAPTSTRRPVAAGRAAELAIEITHALSSSLEIREILFLLVRRVAEVVGSSRASVVLGGVDDETGYVVAASDDESLRDLPISLEQYPEIKRVIDSAQPFVVEDAATHPLFELTGKKVPAQFRSLTLFPIAFEDKVMGVLFLRFRDVRVLDEEDWRALRAIAYATGIALRNASLLSGLRDHSKKSRSAHVEAEKQVQALQRYVDFFDSLADGIIVLGEDERVVFCNPAACVICGRDEEEMRGARFETMLSDDGEDRYREVRASFAEGLFPQGVDLPIKTGSDEHRILNVSFSSVLREHDGVIVSLRDVTYDRALDRELNKTKEFLQRVIDSSVDAIVSADIRGKVLLFNPAAERTYGYDATEVVESTNVRDLYPEGVAQEVMREILSEDWGGAGVLQGYETEILGKGGKTVPVMLSAALIMNRDRPVGSVGVFKDRRDLLRIEERLKLAQRELADQEQKAFIAELAGATAHELNQPLTTVMGYAGMLNKQLDGQPRLGKASAAIVRETERMAEIVRKIGKLTKFESKAYVGDTKIIDIERSIDSEPPVNGR